MQNNPAGTSKLLKYWLFIQFCVSDSLCCQKLVLINIGLLRCINQSVKCAKEFYFVCKYLKYIFCLSENQFMMKYQVSDVMNKKTHIMSVLQENQLSKKYVVMVFYGLCFHVRCVCPHLQDGPVKEESQ